MRVDRFSVQGFRNLGDFSIDFDESRFATVLIGENGTGKSNLIEALVLVFRHLDVDLPTGFAYDIVYECRGRKIRAQAALDSRPIVTIISGESSSETALTLAAFRRMKDELLPKYVFAYYSGPSTRLRSYFEYHQARYYNDVINDESGNPPPIRRLFYCLPEHSRWVLLAYFLRGESPPPFLQRFFGITSFESALLVLKRPRWAEKWTATRPPPPRIRANGDERFWWSRGVVKTFLQRLWDESLAPIRRAEPHQEDYRYRATVEDRLYLYLPSADALRRLNDQYPDEASLFSALESTDISDLVRDVRVRVTRGGATVVFSELSEGEQQLLTVVGLMQFTRHEESLFLLDEPDTHLNPVWKLRYLRELAAQAGLLSYHEGDAEEWLDRSSQLILTTHDPLTIAGLEASQVMIFKRNGSSVVAEQPDEDPRGLGVAGVLIRMFGLPSTLDLVTQSQIDRRNALLRLTSLTNGEEEELTLLTSELDDLGLAYDARDPRYRRFLVALHEWEQTHSRVLESMPETEQDSAVAEILAELMAESG